MNERLKELAREAGYLPDSFGVGHWDMPECKKFAELVVRECNQAVLEVPPYYKDYRSQIEEATICDCARAVLERFGVEE